MSGRRRRPGGVPFGAAHRSHIRAKQRQAEAVRLRCMGWDFAAIAVAVGYASASGAHAAYRAALAHASPAIREDEARLDLARLDRLLVAVLPQAVFGSLRHIRAAAALIEQHAELAAMIARPCAQHAPRR